MSSLPTELQLRFAKSMISILYFHITGNNNNDNNNARMVFAAVPTFAKSERFVWMMTDMFLPSF